jgi:hypothetical protein
MGNESLDRFGSELADRLISRRSLLGSAGLAAAGFSLPGAAHAETKDGQDAPRLPLKIVMDAPNVIITSHTAGQSQFAWPRTEAVFVENVRRFVHNLPLLNQVDKQAGF